jgi:SpoVK/Ycf46/Vps4 family AAA+-type ATPase
MSIKHKNDDVAKYIAIEPNFTLDKDLVVSKTTRLQLDEAVAKIKYHKKIYQDWNFISVDPLGANTILNFYGPPGTGKTLAAEALAGTLCSPIIKIGIAEIESKFMGDTAKNIQECFKSASNNNAILFFDEADTLLGKRLSSVTQGVDNEVNSMRSTLLIELEKFDGIVIFATNFAKNYDSAFRSRISHHIKFDLPDFNTRIKIWDKMLINNIPLIENREDLINKCSELSEGFSGREIRTAMRLSLPKAFMESEKNKTEATLKLEYIQSAIIQINLANKEVSINISSNTFNDFRDTNIATALLGMNKNKQGE